MTTTLALSEIRIDGEGDTCFVNYVVAFADGSVKVGVTSNIFRRLAELMRQRNDAKVLQCVTTPEATRTRAFKTEREICRMFRMAAQNGSREWLQKSVNLLVGASGMFWILNNPGAAYSAKEVVL